MRVRPENESSRSYYDLWPFGGLKRHNSAEILEFKYGLTLGIGSQKNMARTGVFVLVVYARKNYTSGGGCQPSMILT